MVSSFFCNRCRDGVYNFLRCHSHQDLEEKNKAWKEVAKGLLAQLRKKEQDYDRLETDYERKSEQTRDLKRRLEAWLLHGFGSKCCYMGLDQNQFE